MGCIALMCEKQSYTYSSQEKLLLSILPQFQKLAKCYSNDFVMKAHKNLLLTPYKYIFMYQKRLEHKHALPHIVLEKWKLILFGTNITNQNYIDCLGFDKQAEEERITSKTYRFSRQNPFEIRIQDLYFHESYKQIQKDAPRAYSVPQLKQELFQKVLKKIANHFPQSGYALGINYIVGYFLLIGMSEIDSFWMFVHLALNQKFLALGFFQPSFPLAKVIIEVFKNILKRKNKKLYEHIYHQMLINDESWILKWIISFYLSTFPIQFCHYILDYVITFGILGLANVAFAVVCNFQNLILKYEDEADFNLGLKDALNFQSMSKSFSLQKFMSFILQVDLQYEDLNGIQKSGDNFYTRYFRLYAQWHFKKNESIREKMEELMSVWYKSITEKRSNFTILAKSFGQPFFNQNKISEKSQQIEEEHLQKSQKSLKREFQRKQEQKQDYLSANNMELPVITNVRTINVKSRSGYSEKQRDQPEQLSEDPHFLKRFSFYQKLKTRRRCSEGNFRQRKLSIVSEIKAKSQCQSVSQQQSKSEDWQQADISNKFEKQNNFSVCSLMSNLKRQNKVTSFELIPNKLSMEDCIKGISIAEIQIGLTPVLESPLKKSLELQQNNAILQLSKSRLIPVSQRINQKLLCQHLQFHEISYNYQEKAEQYESNLEVTEDQATKAHKTSSMRPEGIIMQQLKQPNALENTPKQQKQLNVEINSFNELQTQNGRNGHQILKYQKEAIQIQKIENGLQKHQKQLQNLPIQVQKMESYFLKTQIQDQSLKSQQKPL